MSLLRIALAVGAILLAVAGTLAYVVLSGPGCGGTIPRSTR